jgi:hypothetical protein
MGLFDWFKSTSQNGEATAPPPSELGAVKEDYIVQGLDFVAAIEAHRKWKDRLSAYIAGTSDEKLDASAICQDDKCALGKWIYSEGKIFCGHMPQFHGLKATHAQFHIHASEIVKLAETGQTDAAMQALLEGDYARDSRQVQTQLSKLYMEMKS